MEISFRTIPREEDIKNVREIVASTGFFHDHELDVAVELVEEFLKSGEESGYYFVFAEIDGKCVAYTCYGPDPMTKSCFELYWIVTHNDFRKKGIGQKLLEYTHSQAAKQGCSMIVAETSGREKYKPTREFYDSTGYKLEAVLKDYYDKGDDKYIYVRRFQEP